MLGEIGNDLFIHAHMPDGPRPGGLTYNGLALVRMSLIHATGNRNLRLLHTLGDATTDGCSTTGTTLATALLLVTAADTQATLVRFLSVNTKPMS
jgi:hypothetical protein